MQRDASSTSVALARTGASLKIANMPDPLEKTKIFQQGA
jgi:hypothetical protein